MDHNLSLIRKLLFPRSLGKPMKRLSPKSSFICNCYLLVLYLNHLTITQGQQFPIGWKTFTGQAYGNESFYTLNNDHSWSSNYHLCSWNSLLELLVHAKSNLVWLDIEQWNLFISKSNQLIRHLRYPLVWEACTKDWHDGIYIHGRCMLNGG